MVLKGVCVAFSEGDSEVWYYSSKVQLNELIRSLDNEHWERDLVRAIVEMKDDIIRQMALTEALTHELKGHKRAVLDIESGSLPLVTLLQFAVINLILYFQNSCNTNICIKMF